ncbi:MAG: DNA repair protein RecO [Methyloprofundus sp.]|nr:DNA repair protein RecO [Methyloprofundus sp.]MDT8426596.1 DNA repair protein RecO [Methyloprofundus sp.]
MSSGLEACFLLHHKPYQESSVLIDVLTQNSGKISLIAKGVRQQKAKYLGLLRPFLPLNISYTGAGGLKLLNHAEAGNSEMILPGINTYCGFYLNELIRYFVPIDEPYPDIFLAYFTCLQQLKTQQPIEAALRNFEVQLMQALGYELQLQYDCFTDKPIKPDLSYRFDLEQGASVDPQGKISGATLIAMHRGTYTEQNQLNEAKWLMRQVIDFHLQGKILQSRNLILKLQQKPACKSN